MKKSLLSAMLLLMAVFTAHAQNITVHGTVLSKTDNEPLIGATVLSEATKKGASTDLDGTFTLTVPQGSILTVSYVGFRQQSVKAEEKLTIYLSEDTELLDEVVVIGYQTVKKADLTGAVSVVSTKSLETSADTDPMRAL